MSCCLQSNSLLWILIILLILSSCGNNGGVFSSCALTGCGWPLLAALVYCMCKNGTLGSILGRIGGGCGCGCNG